MMVLLSVAVACNQKIAPSVTTEVKDTTFTKETSRVIDVKVPGYYLGVKKVIECDSNTNKPKPFIIEKKEQHAALSVHVTDQGQLSVDAGCDSLTLQIEARDKEITRLRTEKTKETVIVTQYKTRQIDIVSRWIAGGTVLTVAGFFGVKYLKTLIPFT